MLSYEFPSGVHRVLNVIDFRKIKVLGKEQYLFMDFTVNENGKNGK